ncbi:MAG: ATP-dependent DNA helicase RecQ [Spirochaetales bacterium]|nr:ATP-dependent DNA helicase RecQ [Spirochaetales bacterium]
MSNPDPVLSGDGDGRAPADPIGELARERFGVAAVRPWQRLVMAGILDGVADGERRAARVVVLPTGAGKSLCFQAPALLGASPTLVVYPLLALVNDQARRLAAAGIEGAVLRGGLSAGEREAAFEAIETGRAPVALTNPETLRVPEVLARLSRAGIRHVAVDEAHCVAEWGDSFRPAYLELGDSIRAIAPSVITAFTATASPPVLARVAEVLFGGLPWSLASGDPDRPNIAYRVDPCLCKLRATERLARERPGPMLVFRSSRDGARLSAEALARRLGRERVRWYHAGLERAEKRAVEEWFMPSGDGILVATVAFGMGVDKADIRTVVHWDPPPSVESYLQESGRAGRDGEPSLAVLLLGPNERVRGDDPVARARSAALLAWARDEARCRREGLLVLLGDEGAKSRACGGCDVCSRDTRASPEGLAVLAEFARVNSGRYGTAEALDLLRGRGPAGRACPGRAAMADWSAEDLRELYDSAKTLGFVGAGRDGRLRGSVARERRSIFGKVVLVRIGLRNRSRRFLDGGLEAGKAAPAPPAGPSPDRGHVPGKRPREHEYRERRQGAPVAEHLERDGQVLDEAVYHGAAPAAGAAPLSPRSSAGSHALP